MFVDWLKSLSGMSGYFETFHWMRKKMVMVVAPKMIRHRV
jgi:hypothetical protein